MSVWVLLQAFLPPSHFLLVKNTSVFKLLLHSLCLSLSFPFNLCSLLPYLPPSLPLQLVLTCPSPGFPPGPCHWLRGAPRWTDPRPGPRGRRLPPRTQTGGQTDLWGHLGGAEKQAGRVCTEAHLSPSQINQRSLSTNHP